MEERRGLVSYSRLDAIEMDRRARDVEREALDRLRAILPPNPHDEQLDGLANRLRQMDSLLEALAGRTELPVRSRALEEDDIRWRAFEDISWMLEIG
jgi:hypothetical protein